MRDECEEGAITRKSQGLWRLTMQQIAKNLKKFRVDLGMTQEDLANKMHVTRQTVSNWENGKSQPDIPCLESLAEVFNKDLLEFIYGSSKEPYIKYQKKYIIMILICIAVFLCSVILEFTVYQKMIGDFHTYFMNGFEISLYVSVVRPAAFFSLGVLIPAAVSLWQGIYLDQKVRHILLVIACILLLLSLIIVIERLLLMIKPDILPGFIFLSVYTSDFARAAFLAIMPFLSGVGVFLGVNKK